MLRHEPLWRPARVPVEPDGDKESKQRIEFARACDAFESPVPAINCDLCTASNAAAGQDECRASANFLQVGGKRLGMDLVQLRYGDNLRTEVAVESCRS